MIGTDRQLDTIAICMGHGVQVETSRTIRHDATISPAYGLRLGIFTGSDTDEHRYSPAESATTYLNKDDTDKLIALLQEHRARMNEQPAAIAAAAAGVHA